MVQLAVSLYRKLYKSGEKTEARITLRIQIDSVCNCGALEVTMKLVNRIILVMAHIVRATNMRITICLMIFLFQLRLFRGANRSPDLCRTNLDLSKEKTHLRAAFIPGVHISFESEKEWTLL